MNHRKFNLRTSTIVFTLLLTSGILLLGYLAICVRELNSFSKLIDDKIYLETRIASSLIQQNYGLGNIVELRRTLDTLSGSLNHTSAVFRNDTGEVLWEYAAPAAGAAAGRGPVTRLFLPAVFRLAKKPAGALSVKGGLVTCGADIRFSNGEALGTFSWTFPIEAEAAAMAQRLLTLLATFLLLTVFLTFFVYRVSNRILKPLPELIEKIRREFGELGMEYKGLPSTDISFISDSFDDLIRGWKTSRDKLLASSKLAAIGQTTAMLAHDVRKPFSMVKMLLSTVDTMKNNPSDLGRAKAEVNKAIKHVEAMISDVMDFSREIELTRAPRGLAGLLDYSIRQAAHGYYSADIAFAYDLRGTLKPMVDEERIGRVFSNIIGNAIEAITILGKKNSGVISIASRDAGAPFVEIVIGNDGPGFGEGDLPKLFESFFTKGKQKGTGLGLASAKKIVELHGGEIAARNREGGAGVEFIIRLPASAEREDAAPESLPGNLKEMLVEQRKQDEAAIDSAVGSLARSGRAIKMLILEDEALYRASVRNTIKKHEDLHRIITLYETKSVADALQLVEKEGIDYAIVDIDLGEERNGFDFLAEIKNRFPKVAAMVHSNRTLKEDIEKAVSLGARVFVPKPLAIEDLVAFVAEAPGGPRPRRVVMACDDDALARRCADMTLRAAAKDAEILIFPDAESLLSGLKGKIAEGADAEYTVFTDQNMGRMSGLELTAAIRALNIPCRIYMISNEPRSEFAPRALAAGADAYFEGPLDEAIVAKTIAGSPSGTGKRPVARCVVLLDDDTLVHLNWKMAAKAAGVELKAFKEPGELLPGLDGLPADTPIYLDSDLGGGVKGEAIAEELRAKGFTDLTMATGHAPERFAALPWLKVAGKEPPW